MGGADWIPSRFTDLEDTFSYAGNALKALRVNAGETAIEPYTIPLPSWNMEADWVSVVADYNADPTGATDSTTAFQNALASGKNVYMPPGSYLVSGTLVIATAGQVLAGPSWAGAFGGKPATFLINSPTLDFLIVEGNYASVGGFGIKRASGVTAIVGADITLGVDHTLKSVPSRQTVRNIQIMNPYVGLKVIDHWAAVIENIDIVTPKWAGVHTSSPPPYGGSVYRNIRIGGDGTAPYGIYIDQADYNQWNLIGVAGSGGFTTAHIFLRSQANIIGHQEFSNLYLDNVPMGAYAIRLEKNGSLDVTHNSFRIVDANAANGQVGYVGAGVEQTSFLGVEVRPSDALGGNLFDIYGKDTSLIDVKVGYDLGNTSGKKGIVVYSGASGTIITACRIRKMGYAVHLMAGSTNNVVEGNDFTGNVSGAMLIDSGVRATSKIYGNLGVDDYITSIANPPEFVGQTALVNGTWYIAVGTASVNDWKVMA